jgi:hypothetical protein
MGRLLGLPPIERLHRRVWNEMSGTWYRSGGGCWPRSLRCLVTGSPRPGSSPLRADPLDQGRGQPAHSPQVGGRVHPALRRRAGQVSKRRNGEASIFPYRNGYAAYAWVTTPDGERKRKWIYGRTHDEVHEKWIKLETRGQPRPNADNHPDTRQLPGVLAPRGC